MALTPTQKWVAGGTIAAVAIYAGYKLFHSHPRQRAFLPSGHPQEESRAHHHHHEHHRGEYCRKKHHRRRLDD